MTQGSSLATIREKVESIYREEGRRVFATLIRLIGDFDLAEDAVHDAFAAALEQWPKEGVPNNPRAWLVSAGRFKAIDSMRRRARFDASLAAMAERIEADAQEAAGKEDEAVKDDQLRLIFTCCHPALPAEARVALTLREVCGLTTEEIARAFLTAPQRLRSESCGQKPRSATLRSPIKSPLPRTFPTGSIPRSKSSIWCSTRGITRRQGTR